MNHFPISPAQVVDATGINMATLRGWMQRKLLVMRLSDEDSESLESLKQGSARRFSRHRLLQVAVAKQLGDHGVPIETALAVAGAFSDAGTLDRLPGRLFADPDLTFLTAWQYPEDPSGWRYRVSKVPKHGTVIDLMSLAGGGPAFICLCLNQIVRRLREECARLGIDHDGFFNEIVRS